MGNKPYAPSSEDKNGEFEIIQIVKNITNCIEYA